MISVMFIASSSGARYAAISRYRSTVFGARFSSACCFMNSARSIARVVGIGAATPAAPAFAISYFFCSSVRRTDFGGHRRLLRREAELSESASRSGASLLAVETCRTRRSFRMVFLRL